MEVARLLSTQQIPVDGLIPNAASVRKRGLVGGAWRWGQSLHEWIHYKKKLPLGLCPSAQTTLPFQP
jgi:hypothetical protein